ncbi:hypothetical protein AB1Y20_007094 [Prymnesium parvum]|uniref:Uncharacterized protein n=1 Tax=Prymnesium parvum TaxID=97485 RepID=A0AB34J1T1_PRYPA
MAEGLSLFSAPQLRAALGDLGEKLSRRALAELGRSCDDFAASLLSHAFAQRGGGRSALAGREIRLSAAALCAWLHQRAQVEPARAEPRRRAPPAPPRLAFWRVGGVRRTFKTSEQSGGGTPLHIVPDVRFTPHLCASLLVPSHLFTPLLFA